MDKLSFARSIKVFQPFSLLCFFHVTLDVALSWANPAKNLHERYKKRLVCTTIKLCTAFRLSSNANQSDMSNMSSVTPELLGTARTRAFTRSCRFTSKDGHVLTDSPEMTC